MTYTTVQVEAIDRHLRDLTVQLHDNTWDPDEQGCIRDDIDQLLEQRALLTQARHNA